LLQFQLLFSSAVNIIQFLSLSFEGPAKWFFLGYLVYIILVVAIAVTAVFNHLEINMGKKIRGLKAVLAWIHLIGMNVGGNAITLTMYMQASAVARLTSNPALMAQFIPSIAAFAGLRSLGVMAGGISYIATYLQKN
jgi:hypothetical protein